MTSADKPDRDLINALDRLSADAEPRPTPPPRTASPASAAMPQPAPAAPASAAPTASANGSTPVPSDSRGSSRVAPPPSPGSPQPAATARRPSAPAPPADDKSHFRCLSCGYRLEEHSGFRCPECGQAHARAMLERWFGGAEQRRVERVLWLIRACLILKLWILPGVAPLAAIATAGAGGWACMIAGRGKEQTLGWHYAVAGMLVAGLLLLASLLPGFAVGAAIAGPLEAVCACLLLITLLSDQDGDRIARGAGGTRLAHMLIVAAPILALLLSMLTALVQRASFAATWSGWFISAAEWGVFLAPQLFALAVWIWVWWRVERLRRALFAPHPNDQ
ncbi:MAG: hypothetical protein CHACPFDD_00683 [Phycisphaerae bacterium]|nr:hypothetical protein [Phycisphaerae bacterium]